MQILLIMVSIQGFMGAFDTIYHHELKERLPWRKTAAKELKLHGIRSFFYSIIFMSLGWLAWNGIWAWIFASIFVVEIIITLYDFVEEDRTRKLPSSERVIHTIVAVNYGAVLALFVPVLLQWSRQPTGFTTMNFGVLSWMMTFYAVGVFVWGWRDLLRGRKLARIANKPKPLMPALNKPHQHILVTGGTGFIGKPLCQGLIDQGHYVTVLTRKMEKAAGLFHGRVTLIESIERLNDDEHFDTIVNLAGEPISQRWKKQNMTAMLESRIGVTEALISFMKRARHKPAVFISGSAIGVYGTDADRAFTENSESSKDLTGEFPREICERWEAAAMQAEDDAGVRTCLLRTGVVLETDGGALAQMLFPFEFGLGGPMGSGRQWFSWIHREDMIGLIAFLINNNISGPVNATAPEPVENKTFSRALGKAMKRPALIALPAFQVKLLFGKMGETILLAGQKVLPDKLLSNGFKFQYSTIDLALANIFKNKNV